MHFVEPLPNATCVGLRGGLEEEEAEEEEAHAIGQFLSHNLANLRRSGCGDGANLFFRNFLFDPSVLQRRRRINNAKCR
jgi:hypothetical protein